MSDGNQIFEAPRPSRMEDYSVPQVYGQYHEVGEKIVDWAMNGGWPRTIVELRAEIGHAVTIPNHYQHLYVVQGSYETLVLRLPPKWLVHESDRKFCQEEPIGIGYELPSFYNSVPRSGDSKQVFCNFFRSRVADYTMSVCK